MRLLYVLNSGDPGGMEQHVLDLVDQMVCRGHDVFVWCKAGVVSDSYKQAGAKVCERGINHDIDPAYIIALTKFIKAHAIQLVHGHEPKAVVNALLAAWLAGTKARVSHVHTPIAHWQVTKVRKIINSAIYGLVVNALSSKEIALTESVKKVKSAAGILASKLCIIPNGINVYKFYFSSNEKAYFRRDICKKHALDSKVKIIGTLSRLTREKGHTVLLEAFAALISRDAIHKEDYVLMLCGGGELAETLWQQAGDLGIKDRLVITGQFDEDLKVKYYAAFDYFVFPSLAEGFGLVLIEALTSGLKVVCSDLPVLKEVGGTYPLYFKSGDELDLADKLARALQEQPDQQEFEAQKNHVASKYSLQHFAEKYENLYKELTEK